MKIATRIDSKLTLEHSKVSDDSNMTSDMY